MIARILIPLIIWQLSCSFFVVPSYILPSPSEISLVFIEKSHYLSFHLGLSVLQVISGLFMGVICAFFTAIGLFRSAKITSIALPYLISLKNLPLFAFAPLLMLWMGHGFFAKAFLITFSCYFPMVVGLLDGFNRTPKSIDDMLATISRKSYLREIWVVRLPYALPSFFTSMKLAFLHAPMSVIACDWIGAHVGLGYIMMIAYGQMDLPILFACLFMLLFFGLLLYKLSKGIEHYFINKLNLKYV